MDAGKILRVCGQCSKKLLPPVIINLQRQAFPKCVTFAAFTLSGRQIANIEEQAMPTTLAELGNRMIDAYEDVYGPDNCDTDTHTHTLKLE